MRICVVSTGDASRDPRLRALVASLVGAGNDVCLVSGPNQHPTPEGLEVQSVPSVLPSGASKTRRYLRRLVPQSTQTKLFRRRLVDTARRTGASLFYPLARRDLDVAIAAAGATGSVFHPPRWRELSPRNIVNLAPDDVRWSRSNAGAGLVFHSDRPYGVGSTPEPNRHAGRRVTLVYRGATTSPGRYVDAALQRAGVTVTRLDGVVDRELLGGTEDAIVFVESAYPAFNVVGSKPDVPILFWVHHGEHHIEANVRLADRYGADAILLAHSWHLAHRFGVPVHRFPFAAAPEISDTGGSFAERSYDVAMVAAGLEHTGGTYTSRQTMAANLTNAFPDTSMFGYGLPPEELASLYSDTRVVPNEGGTSHYPVTMRVFESIGNGARLLTEWAPGLDKLLEPELHYVTMGADPVEDTQRVLSDPSAPEHADAARSFVMGHHTYDHRVDQLFKIVDGAVRQRGSTRQLPSGSLASLIDLDVEIQVIFDLGGNNLVDHLSDREVRQGQKYRDRLKPGSVDAVVVGPDEPDDVDDVLLAARSYVFASGAAVEPVVGRIEELFPRAVVDHHGPFVRIDLGHGSYRSRPSSHPLA